MKFVLGVDLGTSYFKLGLFNPDGELCGLGRIEVPKNIGNGSRCEVPVPRFWSLLQQGVAEACVQAKARPNQIKAVAYSSQANSFLLMDQKQQPLTPLILWCDNRAKPLPEVGDLFEKENFLERSGLGLPCSYQFCAAKVSWFQKQQPDLWNQAARLMTLSDYLTYSLTNQFVGDAGTASLLGLLDIHNREWQPDIVDLSAVKLSKPLMPGTVAGPITPSGAELLGISPGIPFVVGSLDHHIAALGAGVGQLADMSESTGTVLACLNYTTTFHPKANICTGTGLNTDTYYQLAFDNNGAAALEWYQKQFAPELTLDELGRLATDVPIGSAGLFARPEAHHYSGNSGFESITEAHLHGHFFRAMMESTAVSLLKLVQFLADTDFPKRIVATGGGAKSDFWLQIKADLFGTEFITTQSPEPACLGAGLLAALAAGWFPNLTVASRHWIKINKAFFPIPEHHRQYAEWYRQHHQINHTDSAT
ncbi:hypothetical protein KAH55_09905, partial [bacterium]|nr:hypothetical protein [bacterium]